MSSGTSSSGSPKTERRQTQEDAGEAKEDRDLLHDRGEVRVTEGDVAKGVDGMVTAPVGRRGWTAGGGA